MSTNAGALLWNREHITLQPGATDVDTGLKQVGQAFGNSSISEPPLGVSGTVDPGPGATPASRVQVIPMAPLTAWGAVTHDEPWFDTTTGTVHVTFHNGAEIAETINVLFWDPDTKIGPGQAQPYGVIS